MRPFDTVKMVGSRIIGIVIALAVGGGQYTIPENVPYKYTLFYFEVSGHLKVAG